MMNKSKHGMKHLGVQIDVCQNSQIHVTSSVMSVINETYILSIKSIWPCLDIRKVFPY